MKIIHIITGLDNGGAEAILYRLCTFPTVHRHIVISLKDEGKYGPLLKEKGVVVHCLNMPRGRVNISGLKMLWRVLQEERPEVVQTWMYHADLIGSVFARLAGIRQVCWGIRHSNLEFGKSRFTTICIAKICAVLSLFIPRVIVCCAQNAIDVHKAMGYCEKKFVLIPNGVDLRSFCPDIDMRKKLRMEWGIDSEIPLLGMVARYDAQKDHKNLICALGKLKEEKIDFRCALVGNGLSNDNSEILSWLDNASVSEQVLLLGPRSDMPAVMNALDINVLSSAFGEAFPNVLAEAMACGTPCVATDVGDATSIVGDTGWIVPPEDPGALASALMHAIAERRDSSAWSLRKTLVREHIAENFSIEKMVNSYVAIWEKYQ